MRQVLLSGHTSRTGGAVEVVGEGVGTGGVGAGGVGAGEDGGGGEDGGAGADGGGIDATGGADIVWIPLVCRQDETAQTRHPEIR
jgi:hypothetical protein